MTELGTARVCDLVFSGDFVEVWLALEDGRRVVFNEWTEAVRLPSGEFPAKGETAVLRGRGRLPESVWIQDHQVFVGSDWWSGAPPTR